MKHVAIDIGASGGTVSLGTVTPESFTIAEVSRFDNRPVDRDGRYVWGLDALRRRIVDGLRAAGERPGDIDTAGIDTWGLDFGLLSDGEVLRDPVSYRDPDVTATRESLLRTVGRRRLFDVTGITNWNTPNTLWQLHTLAQREPEVLESADRLLMMPQLLTSLLGGERRGEVTIASTTQMVDPQARSWATELLEELSLPTELLPSLAEPGRQLGSVSEAIADEIGFAPDLVAPASHDTAAAVAGLPLADDAAFLNTGSWFILGVERSKPVRTDRAFERGLSNELGADGTVRLLRNINGFFILEECREAWRNAGETVAYDDLLSAARSAPPRESLVDPDADAFGIDAPMPEQIRSYCRRTEQPVPTDQGAVVRCILDSLVTKTATALDRIEAAVGSTPAEINLGGGGVRNDLFCQLLADATARPVVAGPVEATTVGNVLTQSIAAGTIPDLDTGRQLIRSEFSPVRYEPEAGGGWERSKVRMRALPTD